MMRTTLLLAVFVAACGTDRIHLGGSSPASDGGAQAPLADASAALDAQVVPTDGGAAREAGAVGDAFVLDDGGGRDGREDGGREDGGRGDGQHR